MFSEHPHNPVVQILPYYGYPYYGYPHYGYPHYTYPYFGYPYHSTGADPLDPTWRRRLVPASANGNVDKAEKLAKKGLKLEKKIQITPEMIAKTIDWKTVAAAVTASTLLFKVLNAI